MISGTRRDILAGAVTLAGLALVAGEASAQEHAAVASAVAALNKAVLDVDRDKRLALTAEQLSDGHSAGRIETRRQFVDYLAPRASLFRKSELSEQTIGMVGHAAIVGHHLVGETVNPQGQVSPVRIGALQVWQKPGGNRMSLARQAYRA